VEAPPKRPNPTPNSGSGVEMIRDVAALFGEYSPLLLYGGMASLALWATWRDRCLFWVAFWIGVSFVVSNSLWWAGVPASDRPGIYTMLEVLISVAAVCAWERKQRYVLVAVVCAAALSVCANIAFASISVPTLRHIHAWEWTTNLCFAAECLLTSWGGISYGYESGRFVRWPFANRSHIVANAHTKGES
jgi:hypothetical protein